MPPPPPRATNAAAIIIFLILFLAFNTRITFALPTTVFEHEPENQHAPTTSSSLPASQETSVVAAIDGASLLADTKGAIIGCLFVFLIAIAALTCLGYKSLRDSCGRATNRVWGVAHAAPAAGPGPGGSVTLQMNPFPLPPQAVLANTNGNRPIEMRDLRPIPVHFVRPRFT